VFIAGLGAFRLYDRHKFARIAAEREAERKQSFERFLEKDGEPLETLCRYDAYWDQMVDAIAKRDKAWFERNVDDAALNGYRANAAWIYGPDATLIYSKDSSAATPPPFPLPPEAFAKLFATNPLAYFFIKIQDDVYEIRGATVHGSSDEGRQTPQRGYLFVGRVWNMAALEEKAMFSNNNKISLVPPGRYGNQIKNDEHDGLIVFSRPLKAWDGTVIAELVVRNESPTVFELNRSSERLWVAFCAFAIVVLLLISLSIVRWVSQPLRKIMDTLKRNDPAPIEHLCWDHSEFGEMARTTRKFFEQRDNLVREMEERRATEEALRKSEEELRHSQKMEAVGRL
ncbi:MAG: hypothetical protein DME70_07435, partial [Verrucomicrobia bacterium]